MLFLSAFAIKSQTTTKEQIYYCFPAIKLLWCRAMPYEAVELILQLRYMR